MNKGFKPLVQKGLLLALLFLITHSSFIITSNAMTITVSSGNAGSGLVGHWPLSEESETTGNNLLTNGSFETGDFTGWTDNGVTASSIDANNPKDGAYRASITPGNSNLRYSQTISVNPGKTYQLSGWYKVENHTTGDFIVAGLTKGPWYSNASVMVSANVSEWTYFSKTFTPDEVATYTVEIGYAQSNLNPESTALLDNVVVKEIQTADTTPTSNNGTIYGATYTAGPTGGGLGEQLVTNGTFSNWTSDNPDSWGVGGEVASDPMVTESNGAARFFTTGDSLALGEEIPLTVGTKYALRVEVTDVTSGSINVYNSFTLSENQIGTLSSTGAQEIIFTAVKDGIYLKRTIGATDVTIDNLSVREIVSGQALAFDGVDDYVEKTSVDLGISTTDQVTVSAWVWQDSTAPLTSGSTRTITIGDNNDGIDFKTGNDGLFGFAVAHDDASGTNDSVSITEDRWVHLVGTIDSSRLKMYKNGVLSIDKALGSTGIKVTSNIVRLGTNAASYSPFKGKLANVRIYDRALSSTEILGLYEGSESRMTTGNTKKGLVAHWPLTTDSIRTDDRSLDNSSAGTSSVPSSQAYGTWEFDFYTATGNTSMISFIEGTTAGVSTAGYNIWIRDDSGLSVGIYEGTSTRMRSDYGYILNNTWYRLKVTRNLSGEFTMWIKGGAFGESDWTLVDITGGSGTNPVTDATTTTSSYMVSDLDAGDKIRNIWTNTFGGIPVTDFTDGTGTTAVTGNQTVADLTPTDNHSTLYGTQIHDCPNDNCGYSFDGSADYVTVNVDSWIRDTDTITLSGWYYHNAATNGAPWGILTDVPATPTSDGFWWHPAYSGNTSFLLRTEDDITGEQGYSGVAPMPFTLGNWHYVTTVVGTNKVDIYVNGILYKSWTPTFSWANINSDTAFLTLGYSFATSVNGNVSDVKLYNRELSTTEISRLYNGTNITTGLVGHWPLLEDADDISGNGNDGTVTGATLIGAGNVASFDGVNDYIDAGNPAELNFGEESFTISTWVSSDQTGTTKFFLGKADGISASSSKGYTLYLGSLGTVWTFGVWDGSSNKIVSSTAPTIGEYYMVTGVFDKTTNRAKLYINGVYKSQSATTAIGNIDVSDNLTIGMNSGSYFDGNLSDTRIYDRPLSAMEITSLYDEGREHAKQLTAGNLNKGLVGHWPLTLESVTTGDNILTNPGFEDGTTGWSNERFTVASNSSVYKSGAKSYEINQLSLDWADMYQAIVNASTYVGKTLVYSLWLRGDTGNIDNSDYKTEYPHIHTNLDTDGYRLTATNGSTATAGITEARFLSNDWNQYTGSYTVEPGITSMDFVPVPLWVGKIPTNYNTEFPGFYVDDVSLKVLKTADTTPNDNHGTLMNDVTFRDCPNDNCGYSFDGDGDKISPGSYSYTAGDEFSVAFWAQSGTQTTFGSILAQGSKGLGNLMIGATGYLYWDVGGTGNCSDSSQTTWSDGNWHHGSISYDGTDISLYVDGAFVKTCTVPAPDDDGNPVYLGVLNSGNTFSFDGNLSDVRVYDTALTADEIAKLHDGKNIQSGLVRRWPLLENANDVSGSGYNGTVTGATLVGSGNVAEFDGVDDYMIIAQPTIETDPNVFTISGWINPNDLASRFISPMSNGYDQAIGYTGGVNQYISVKITESMDINNRSHHSAVGSVPLNMWTHWTVSINDKNIKIYINGVLDSEYTETIDIAGWTGTWFIGQRGISTNWYSGQLSDLRVYNRILSATEIEQLSDQGRP